MWELYTYKESQREICIYNFIYGEICIEECKKKIVWTNETHALVSDISFLTFINDYIKKTWVYLLREKYECFTIFKRFKALVEKEIIKYVKVSRSYRCGE